MNDKFMHTLQTVFYDYMQRWAEIDKCHRLARLHK